MSLSNWSTTTASNATVGTNPWAEGMSPAAVNDAARERMADVRAFYEGMEWRDWGHTPTYVAATAFSISSASSLISIYSINRRIRTIDAGGTAYGTIVDTTWVSSTQTVHIDNSVSLTNPMTSVAVGLDIANQPIHASGIAGSTAYSIAQAVLTTPGDMIYASATATAARLAVGATTAVLVGGTTPSWTAHPTLAGVSIGNVTSVTTAGAAYIQNGVYEGSTPVRLAAGWQWISTTSVTSSTAVTFTSLGTYDVYKVVFEDAVPSGTSFLTVRVSTDGTTYYSGASDYAYAVKGYTAAGADDSGGNAAAAYMSITGVTGVLSTASLGGMSGEVTFYNLNKTSVRKNIVSSTGNSNNGAILNGFGQALATTAVSSAVVAVDFEWTASATFSSGNFYLYGLRKS